jgi:CRISPR/Cas system endoribonuclease Cas6 (RAMP superfamily)
MNTKSRPFKYIRNDDWETPIDYWRIIEPYIPKDLTIHDPFFMNGNSYNWWRILGREIIHENKDFFLIKKNNQKEIYVSSPPFSIFNQVLKHLFYLNKPFIMLIPLYRVAQIKTQKILKDKKNIQIIVSPIYKGFIDRDGDATKCPPQYLCYLCCCINLPKDLLFI